MSIILTALTALVMSASAAKRPITFPSDPLLTSGTMENFRRVYVDPKQVNTLLQPLADASTARPRATITKDKVEVNEHIFFASASDQIKPSSYPILSAVAAALRNTPGVVKLQIQGHTDATGDADTNLTLSIRRAKAVRDFLESKGVSAERLDSAGFGASQPLEAAVSEEANAANRRVEFVIQRWSDVPKTQEVTTIGEAAPESDTPSGTSLEVANNYQIPAEVTVNGQKIGEVGPSTVAAIHGLNPGLYDIGFTHITGYTYYKAVRTSVINSPIIPGGKEAASVLPNKGLPTPAE